jgi:hypothetical protein
VKRALLMLGVPVIAIAVAVCTRRAPVPEARPWEPRAEQPRATPAANAWVATMPSRPVHAEAPPERAPEPLHPAGPKPATDSRTALMESRVPALAVAALQQVDSPRQRLLAQSRGPGESRIAQVSRLSERSQDALARLRAARAGAQGEQRARLDRAIHAIERNQGYRTRIVAGRPPPPMGRAGTSDGPVPQIEKPAP